VNVEIARRANDAFNRRDVDALMEFATPDIELISAMSGTVAGGSLRGREGIEALFADIRDTWEEHRMVIEEIRDLGERVLGLGRLEGRGRGSGVSVDVPLAVISDFRRGKVWRTRSYLDHGEALRAAGLEDEAMSQENVEIVRRAIAASTAKPPDFATVKALYHPDHVLTSDWGVEGQTYLGVPGFLEAMADLDAAWQDWHQEVEDVIDTGSDQVLVLVRLKARGRESGAPVDQPWAMLITLRDAKLVASRTYLDRDRALKAIGLAE